MRRLSVPGCALLVLLVVAGVAVPAVAATVTDGPAATLATPGNDTVTQLQLPADNSGANDRQAATADLSGALAADQERLLATIDGQVFEQTFEAAPQSQEQIDAIEAAIERLETQAGALRDSRRQAVRDYNAGKISSAELFNELSRIRAAATALDEQIDRIETTVEESNELSLSSELSIRLSSVEADLVSLDGPVTATVSAVVAGAQPAQPISVESGVEGVVLGTIDDDRFVREATVWSARATSGTDQFASGDEPAPAAAYNRAEELYPWATANLVGSPSLTGIGDTSIYVVGLNHRHGEVTSYLDGRTTDVFYEVQRLRLAQVPTDIVASNATDALSLTVESTFEKGPVVVSVTDGDGEPIEATITAGNTTLGTTNSEGRRWLVGTGQPERITARTDDGETVSVRIDPDTQ